jgi:hypothetical protein
MTRTDEDVLAGVLRVPVGGVEKIVPTLPIRATREWQALLSEKLGGFGVVMAAEQSPATLAAFGSLSLDTILDLVVAYDRTDALGGRDWLEEHADPAQLYGAVRQMAEVVFPFVTDMQTVLRVLPGLLVGALTSPRSTNGRSPTGASTRARSKSASTGRS